MDREDLRYVHTFISDWLSAPIQLPEMHSIEYYEGPEGEVRFFADFRYAKKKIAFRNKIQNPYELSYFGNETEMLNVEIAIHWDEEPKPDYTDDKRAIYFFTTELDEDLEDYVLMPANPRDYKFADNINGVVFDNIKNQILVGVTDLDDLEGFKMSFVAFKVPKGDE